MNAALTTRHAKAMLPASPFLTVEEVGDRLKVRPSTVRKLAHEGSIPYHRIGPKLMRFHFEDVEAFAATCRISVRQSEGNRVA